MVLPQALESNEMRITFMGSMIPLPVRRAQAEMSVFVEVGWQDDPNDVAYHGRAEVSDYCFSPQVQLPTNTMYAPKYNTNGVGDPFAQIDLSTEIPATDTNGNVNYRSDGY